MPLSTSVVLCTCNGARFLAAQWASLLAQSRLPDEIVVRDDASTDATAALLEDLCSDAQSRGVRVRLARNPRNVGYVANFEATLCDASGDVLLLCDQDDVWHADKVAALVAALERRPELLLLCSDARRVDDTGVDLGRSLFEVLKVTEQERGRIHQGQGLAVLLRRSLATGATIALRRSLLPDALPFPDGWIHDEWLAIIAAARGGFDCVDESLVDYRQHGANQIGMPERTFSDQWNDLWQARAAMLDARIDRYRVLQGRLDQLRVAVTPDYRRLVAEVLRHLRQRRTLHGSPWSRLPAVFREAANGRYRRYGAGWRTALRDLVRRG